MNSIKFIIGLIVILTIFTLTITCNDETQNQKTDIVHVQTVDSENEDVVENKNLRLVKNIKFADTATKFDDIFEPTAEWQVVKENQAIPKGLHVRLNMQTGLKEAKLMDDDPTGERMRALNKDLFKEKSKMPSTKINPEEIKKALKDLKDRSAATSGTKFSIDDLTQVEQELLAEQEKSEAEREAIKSKFRSYDELKKDFEAMNLGIKTDSEILNELLVRYNSSNIEKNEKLNVLQDFEYYVHQYDNGLLLCDIGAFNLIMKELNTTNNDLDVKINAALVLGAAMQGNPKVQIYAIDNGLLQILLNLMFKQELNDVSSNNSLNAKIVFLLSSLLRHFPYAQIKFVELGGIQILNDFMQKTTTSHKIKVKILTLIDDLIFEKINAFNENTNNNNDSNAVLRLEQYKRVDIQERLAETNWCNYLTKLLIESKEHDTNEKILISIKTLLEPCKAKIDDLRGFIKYLTKFIDHYKNELNSNSDSNDDNGEYFKHLISLAEFIKENFIKYRNKIIVNEDL